MSPDTYEFENGKKLRLLGEKILVKGHPLPEESTGGIIIPGKACEHVFRTGEILAIGYRTLKNGKRVPIRDIEVGLHCLFVRFLAEQDSNKQLRTRLGEDDVFSIGTTDIMIVWPANDDPPTISL